MAGINEFRANFTGQGARPNRFRVNLNFPALIAGGLEGSYKGRFLCKAAQLPGSNMGIAPVNYMGRIINLPGDRTFEEWTVTIYNDEDFLLRDAFERWSNLANSFRGNTTASDYRSILASPTIDQLGKDDRVLKSYRFHNMWPSVVTPIELDMGSNDTVEEFTVTFQYDEWTSNTTDS